MLVLGAIKRLVIWPEAGIELLLSPLPEDVNDRLVRETTIQETDNDGKLKVRRDIPRYAQLVGRCCIRGWRGVVGADGAETEFTPSNVDQFMLIGPAQDFVFSKVRSLELYIHKEVEAAKNA